MASDAGPPVLIALVDDYDVVLAGVAHMLDPYRDRIVIAEIDANQPVEDEVDIVLYDSFAQPEADHVEIRELVANPRARRVVVYTWNFRPDLVETACQQGVSGYLSKTLPARELVSALEAVHAGELVVSDPAPRARSAPGLDWPGRREGLTDREAEVLALITQGKSNAEVAKLTHLSPNTVKSYIRTIYRKIEVASRTQAVLWGVAHGFTPDRHRIDHWRGGPEPQPAGSASISGMQETDRVELPLAGARSLAWVAGELFDVAKGWRHLPLDGSRPKAHQRPYGAAFDAATVSPAGDVVGLVATTGTKALLLRADGERIRELSRDSYKAGAYRYPLALFTLPDGRTGLVHCPDQYDQLEVEDALTGERLTADTDRTPRDVFHSRLAVSGSGRYLLSAGWLWHPWGSLSVYDLSAGLADPAVLDAPGGVLSLRGLIQAEVSGACFVADDVVVSTSSEPNQPDDDDDLAPDMLVCWSTTERRYRWRRQLDHCAGDLIPMSGGALALNGHPRLYDPATGDLVLEWPDLATGEADSSIVWKKSFSGPARIAVDDVHRRFAVTDGERVVVVSWE